MRGSDHGIKGGPLKNIAHPAQVAAGNDDRGLIYNADSAVDGLAHLVYDPLEQSVRHKFLLSQLQFLAGAGVTGLDFIANSKAASRYSSSILHKPKENFNLFFAFLKNERGI